MTKIQFIPKQIKQLKIVCCLPGSNFSSTFLQCWTDFLMSCTKNNIQVRVSCAEDAVVYYVRNKCLGGDVLSGINQVPFQGKLEYDYMLWIDSDIVFNFSQFKKLLSWDKDIASGIYMMKGGTNFATVINWDDEFYKKNGYFEFLSQKDIEDKKDLIEVSYTGFGFMLVKYGVFESLQYPWFRPEWYNFSETVKDFMSEDVSFCKNIKDKGYKIFIDPTIRVGHEKRITI